MKRMLIGITVGIMLLVGCETHNPVVLSTPENEFVLGSREILTDSEYVWVLTPIVIRNPKNIWNVTDDPEQLVVERRMNILLGFSESS